MPLLDEDSLISSLSSGGRSPVQRRVRKEGHALAVVRAPYSSPSGLVPPIGDVIGDGMSDGSASDDLAALRVMVELHTAEE